MVVACRSMDTVDQHRRQGPGSVGFALVTVSDTRRLVDDRSGELIESSVLDAGHRMVERRLVVDEPDQIRAAVRELAASSEVEVIVLTGGTGLAARDRTVEAVEPLFGRSIEGFGELFRMLSWEQVGAAAMLSRATAGAIGGRAVFLLPGSPKAVKLAMERLILPEARHLVAQLRG